MFGYFIAFGFIKLKTVKAKVVKGNEIMWFKFHFNPIEYYEMECFVKDKTTIEWIKKHIETDKVQSLFVGLRGPLKAYEFRIGKSKCKKLSCTVESIEFMDYKKTGRYALDSSKFYNQNMLNWKSYFSEEDKFVDKEG